MKRLSQTVRVMLALIVATFSNSLLPTAAAYAAGPDQGQPQPVWCQQTGGVWTSQQGSSNNNPNRFALTQLPPNAPTDGSMFIDPTTGQVWTTNSSFDAMKTALDTQCATQQSTVTGTAPTITPICGLNDDIVTYATTPNVTYSQTGWINGSNTISATAAAGYILEGTSSWTYTDNGTAGCIVVSPTAPVFNDICGTTADTYTITATPGITYYVNSVVTTTYGTFPASGTITVTAVANPGYILGSYPAGGWIYTYEGNCPTQVPAQPAPNDPCGLNNATWVLPSDTSTVIWSINTDKHLIATAVTGYQFAPGVTTHDFGVAPDSGELCVTTLPLAPDITDPCGLANATWTTVPADTDTVTWKLSTEGHLYATTTANYKFDDGTTSHDYGVATDSGILCAVVVEPVQTDLCDTEYDDITWSGSEGVTYDVEWNEDRTMATVIASAMRGYAIPDDTQTEWEFVFDNAPCKKVTICHATDSTTNPYNRITVNINAADGMSGNHGQDADHYSHDGPIYYDGIDGKWGDIIPAIDDVHDGLNASTLGQYILDHDCMIPAESVVTYELAPCTFNTNSTDVIKVTVTNTADDTEGDVTYTISLGDGTALNKTVTVADGESTTVTFTGLTSMGYTLTVSSNDGTVFEPATIAVGKCTFTPQVLGTSTTTPRVLPATIADTGTESNLSIVLGLMLSALTYYIVLRRQET